MLISKDTKQIILDEEADSGPVVNFLNDMGDEISIEISFLKKSQSIYCHYFDF